MGILDGDQFDPRTDSTAPPGWLGLVLGPAAAGAAPTANPLPAHPRSGICLALAPATPDRPGAPARFSFLAPGVRRIDNALTGEKFLAQFSPVVQAAVKAAVAGRAPPAANQRPGFAQAIAAIARKYGRPVGPPPDARSEPNPPTRPDPTE